MSGNIQTQEEDRMATEGQLDELRLSVERSVKNSVDGSSLMSQKSGVVKVPHWTNSLRGFF